MRPSPLPALLLTAVLAFPVTAQAQAGWLVRPDDGSPPSGVKVARLTAGWQFTSGPASILYRAADQGRGNFSVTAKLHLSPGAGAHQEAFGIFIGGKDLAGAGQAYTYFLIRGDGTWKVKRREGGAVTDVTPGWQSNPAIARAGGRTPVLNVVRVMAGTERVAFLVNGSEVWGAPRTAVPVEGTVGIRLNHNLSVRLESFATAP